VYCSIFLLCLFMFYILCNPTLSFVAAVYHHNASVQQHHEPYQGNSFPSHHILLCPNAITSCLVLSSWYFAVSSFLFIILFYFLLSCSFCCQIIVSPQQSDTSLSWLLRSMFPPEKKIMQSDLANFFFCIKKVFFDHKNTEKNKITIPTTV